jgi:iron complex outermembrane recepter protein
VSSLGDLERVEVLKGPQGTQFGKNASSGVVNITTARPKLGEFAGNAFASYAELNEHDFHGALNLPVGDTAAVNIFAFHRQYDDYVDNVVLNKGWGGSENYGVRGKFLWEPNETFSAYVIGDWSRNTQNGPGQLWTLNRVPPTATPGSAGFSPLTAARFAAVRALGVTPGFDNEQSV